MRPHFPDWLHTLSLISIVVAALCALLIVLDEFRHPQKMAVMNVVWPLTALFGSVLWYAAYLTWGQPKAEGDGDHGHGDKPFPVSVGIGASHCGAGCTLGDIIAEWLAFALPGIAIWFGWHSLFDEKMFAVWILDFIVAFVIGIAFQYWAIVPMRDVGPGEGLIEALKADAASITSWQVGMYGGMAIIQFAWFRPAYGAIAPVTSPEFWFAMQIAMIAGFVTAYPVNWWLIRAGVKEAM